MQRTVMYGCLAAFCAMFAGQSLALDVGVSGGVGGASVGAGASVGGGGASVNGGASLGGGGASVSGGAGLGGGGASVNGGASLGSGGVGVSGRASVGVSGSESAGVGSLGGLTSSGKNTQRASLGYPSRTIKHLIKKLKVLVVCRDAHNCTGPNERPLTTREIAQLQKQIARLQKRCPDALREPKKYSRDAIEVCSLLESL